VDLLDGGFHQVLTFIYNISDFFTAQGKIVASLCFVLALGMASVKLALGSTDLVKELTKLFITVVTFFVLFWAFPLILQATQKLITEWSYQAVFRNGIQYNPEDGVYSKDEFYTWIGRNAEGVFVTTQEITGGDANNNPIWRKRINVRITHKETGLISINKIMNLVTFGAKVIFSSAIAGKDSALQWIKAIPDMLLALVVLFLFVWSMIKVTINYLTAVIEYVFFQSLGILFIPTMLWDGTKYIFERLAGSFLNITVKLLVIQICLYIAVFGCLEIFKMMFILGEGDGVYSIAFYIGVAFMVYLLRMLCDSASTISDFLCGGSPRLSYGEFAQAVKSSNAGAQTLGSVAKTVAGAGVGIATGLGSSIVNGVKAGQKGGLSAGLAEGGLSLAKSVAHGAGDIVQAGAKAGGTIMRNTGAMLGPDHVSTSEGLGRMGNPFGGSGGGGGGGGEKDKPAGNAKINSGLSSTRMQGARENFQQRQSTGNYNGIRGTMRNGLASLAEYGQGTVDRNNALGDIKNETDMVGGGAGKESNKQSILPEIAHKNALEGNK